MKRMLKAGLVAFLCAAAPAFAQDPSPVGLWKNIDDLTGKPKALIRISEFKGELHGQIEKLFLAPGDEPNPRCVRCSGVHKDQPIIGMVFMSGLRRSDGDAAEYAGGEILDPDNGKVYRSKMTLLDQGKKLNVRGYIGVPMFGRSQVWVRHQ